MISEVPNNGRTSKGSNCGSGGSVANFSASQVNVSGGKTNYLAWFSGARLLLRRAGNRSSGSASRDTRPKGRPALRGRGAAGRAIIHARVPRHASVLFLFCRRRKGQASRVGRDRSRGRARSRGSRPLLPLRRPRENFLLFVTILSQRVVAWR